LRFLPTFVNSLSINDYYYKKWDSLEELFREASNHFLDPRLNETFITFLRELNNLELLCAQKFFSNRNVAALDENGDEETKAQAYTYGPIKDPFPNETWPEADERIFQLQKINLLSSVTK